jgi:predicted RNA-binding protein with TRAM domain
MTRQNVTDGPREILTTKCAVCAGDGFVVSEATHALEIERKLRDLAKGSRVQGFRVEVHPRIRSLLAGPGGSRLEEVEAAARRRFYLVAAEAGNGHVHLDHFEVVKQGKLETLRPEAPVEEGASLELKLVEVGLYDAAAGVGKVGGWSVVVSGAAKLVGKKVSVSVGRVLEGVAYATLADGAVLPAPITFEAEAEKPTRVSSAKKAEAEKPKPAAAPSSRRKTAAEEEEEPSAEAVETEAEDETDDETETDAEAAVVELGEAAVEDSPPTKKRTRRGTRGGRGRKKAPVAALAEGEAESEPEAETAPRAGGDGRARTPRIHVPPSVPVEDGAPDEASESIATLDSETAVSDSEPPKARRSRRGTRGGRKRRKPATNGQGAVDGAEKSSAEELAAVDAPAQEGEQYVPMSEWIEDFERRR